MTAAVQFLKRSGWALFFGVLIFNLDSSLAKAETSVPPAPNDLSIQATSTSLVVSWESGGGDTAGYYIAGAKGSTAPDCDKDDNDNVETATTKNYSGLTPDTKYTISICSYNSSGQLSEPVVASKTTPATETTPPSPVGLTVTATSTSLVASWQSGGGDTAGYYIAGAKGGTAPDCDKDDNDNVETATTKTYSSLTPDTEYTISICSYNSSGQLSEPVVASKTTTLSATPTPTPKTTPTPTPVATPTPTPKTTPTPTPVATPTPTPKATPTPTPVATPTPTPVATAPQPTGLVATALSSTEVSLKWNSNGGSTAGFFVNAVPVNAQYTGIGCGNTNVGDVTAYTFNNLQPDTIYYVSVCSYNSSGTLSDTPAITSVVTTATVLPPQPTGLVATALSSSEVSLKWNGNGGSTAGFFVNAVPVNSQYAGIGCGNTNVGDVTAYTLTNLQPDTIYYVSVCSYDTYGNVSANGDITSVVLQ